MEVIGLKLAFWKVWESDVFEVKTLLHTFFCNQPISSSREWCLRRIAWSYIPSHWESRFIIMLCFKFVKIYVIESKVTYFACGRAKKSRIYIYIYIYITRVSCPSYSCTINRPMSRTSMSLSRMLINLFPPQWLIVILPSLPFKLVHVNKFVNSIHKTLHSKPTHGLMHELYMYLCKNLPHTHKPYASNSLNECIYNDK